MDSVLSRLATYTLMNNKYKHGPALMQQMAELYAHITVFYKYDTTNEPLETNENDLVVASTFLGDDFPLFQRYIPYFHRCREMRTSEYLPTVHGLNRDWSAIVYIGSR